MRISDWSSDVCSSDLIDPLDPGGEGLPRKSVDGEGGALAVLDLTDIGFVDGDLQLHLREIFGNSEEDWCVQRCGDGLSRFDIAGQHYAVDGRIDSRHVAVRLIGRQLRPVFYPLRSAGAPPNNGR